jgi:hypothetical protein
MGLKIASAPAGGYTPRTPYSRLARRGAILHGMPKKANDAARAGAIESVQWYFAEDRPKGPPPKPFWLTYIGTDVVTVPGVGLFQNGTTAEVGKALADRYSGERDWRVEPRRSPAPETDE